MTFDELMKKMLEILPECMIQEDFEGQLVVYTGLRIKPGRDNPKEVLEISPLTWGEDNS